MTAQEILRMIEVVDPADDAGLAKIDAYVWVFLNGIPLSCDADQGEYWLVGTGKGDLHSPPQYTRSRDELKAIRPKAIWSFLTQSGERGIYCNIVKDEDTSFVCSFAPTEELCELYAIIKMIEWERNDVR